MAIEDKAGLNAWLPPELSVRYTVRQISFVLGIQVQPTFLGHPGRIYIPRHEEANRDYASIGLPAIPIYLRN